MERETSPFYVVMQSGEATVVSQAGLVKWSGAAGELAHRVREGKMGNSSQKTSASVFDMKKGTLLLVCTLDVMPKKPAIICPLVWISEVEPSSRRVSTQSK